MANAIKLQDALQQLFDALAFCDEDDLSSEERDLVAATGPIRKAETFSDAGLLTRDKGIVIRLDDGSEFQITVQMNRQAEGGEDEDDE